MIETKFKQTELGQIPKDWTVKLLEDITTTSSGGTPSRAIPQYFQGNIRWFTTSELKDCELNDSFEHISESALNNSSCKLFPKGTLLMAMYGATIGKLGILNNEAATNQACCAIFQSKMYVTKFLYFWLLKERQNIISQSCGSGQPNISQLVVKALLIPIPEKKEQQRIATALSDVDALISALDKKITKKKLIKQGAMQQLLTGKKRLQGFTEPWEEKKLGEILQYEQPTKYIVSSTAYKANGIPVLTAGKTFILGHTHEYWGVYHNVPVIIFDDFVTESKYVSFPFKIKSSAIKILSLIDSNNSLRYVYEIMQTIDFPMTDHKRYWIKEYSQQTILLPPCDEQKAIASVLSSMDKEIADLEAKRAKYEQIKQGMMQQLLTGKIRLIDK